jgi:hypothetical protein
MLERLRGSRAARRWARLIVAGGLILALSPIDAARGQDSGSSSFDGVAAGTVFDLRVKNESIPLLPEIQGAGPVSQARLTSLGQSEGFSAFPYPGEVVVGLPGLVTALTGAPLPQYPLIAKTVAPDPPASVNFPGINLSSESDGLRATSNAVIGQGSTGASTSAQVRSNADGTVTATSSAKVAAFELGGIAKISGFESTASATLEADGKVKAETHLSVGRISVPGLSLTIPAATPSAIPVPIPIPGIPGIPPIALPPIPLPLGGTTIDAPDIGIVDGQFVIRLPLLGGSQFAIPADAVFKAFATSGFNMSFSKPVVTDTGAVGSTLLINTTLPSLPANQFYNGPTDVEIAIGRVSASVQGSVLAGADVGGSATVDIPSGGVGAGFDGGGIDTGAGLGDLGSVGLPTSTGGGSQVALPTQPAGATREPLGDIFDIYLVLLGIGIAGTLSGQVVRFVGVRAGARA